MSKALADFVRWRETPEQRATRIEATMERLTVAMAKVADAKPDPVVADWRAPAAAPTTGAEIEAALVRRGALPSPIVVAVEAVGPELWLGHKETEWYIVFDGHDYVVRDIHGETLYRGILPVQAYNFVRDEVRGALRPSRAVGADIVAAELRIRKVEAEVKGRAVRAEVAGRKFLIRKVGRKGLWEVTDGSAVLFTSIPWFAAVDEVVRLSEGRPAPAPKPISAETRGMLALCELMRQGRAPWQLAQRRLQMAGRPEFMSPFSEATRPLVAPRPRTSEAEIEACLARLAAIATA